MRAYDRSLLNRVARRMEDEAVAEFNKVVAGNVDADAVDAARRKRDRVLGDARDIKDLVRQEDALRDTNMAVVPRVATRDMGLAGEAVVAECHGREVRVGDADCASQVWAAMVAAAPA